MKTKSVFGIMLTLLLIGLLALAFNVQAVKSTATSVSYSTTIIVDGNLSDWEGIEAVVIDEHEDPDGRTFSDDIDRCWLAHNSSYLFIRFDNYYSSSECEIVYFDTDRDNATGYVINDIGADYWYVFEGSFYNHLYRWEGTWVELPDADVYSVSTGEISPAFRDQFEARVSLADIGNPTVVDIVFALEFGDVAPDVGHVTYTLAPSAPPLTASIHPTSASVIAGQSVTFTSTVSGGYTPYSYQWYLNGAPVSGATSDTWTFTPTTSGIYYVYLTVTDDTGNTTQSETARITVTTVPVGGYSVPIQLPTTAKPATLHISLLTILTAIFITIKRKAKRKH